MAISAKIRVRFYPNALKNVVDKYENRSLNRSGAYGRQVQRRSIRKRKRTSQPGQPPSSHTGGLRNNIFYAIEGRSVYWGAIDFDGGRVSVPALLEFGGSYTVDQQQLQERQRRLKAAVGNLKRRGRGKRRKKLSADQFRERARRARQAAQGRKSTIVVRARPYSGPSLDTVVNSGRFADLWGAV